MSEKKDSRAPNGSGVRFTETVSAERKGLSSEKIKRTSRHMPEEKIDAPADFADRKSGFYSRLHRESPADNDSAQGGTATQQTIILNRQISSVPTASTDSGDDTVRVGRSYTQRFTPVTVAPELSGATKEIKLDGRLAGQMSFGDLGSYNRAFNTKEISLFDDSRSWESLSSIDKRASDDFDNVYMSLPSENALPSDKTRHLLAAAAVTAEENSINVDAEQISFPGFQSVNRVTEEELERELYKNRSGFVKKFMSKTKLGSVDSEISESMLITSEQQDSEEASQPQKRSRTEAFNRLQREIDEFVLDDEEVRFAAPVEYASKQDEPKITGYIASSKKKFLIKLSILAVLCLVTLIMSAVAISGGGADGAYPQGSERSYAVINLIAVLVGCVIAFPDFTYTLRAIVKGKYSPDFGVYIMLILAVIQSSLLINSSSSLIVVANGAAPVVLFSLLPYYIGRLVIYSNLSLCFNLFSHEEVLNVLCSFGETPLKTDFPFEAQSNVKYTVRARFVQGFMQNALNALPGSTYTGMVSFLLALLATLMGIIAGFVTSDAVYGMTISCVAVTLTIPVHESLGSVIALFRENIVLGKSKSCVISYSVAHDVASSTGNVFIASQLVEQSACAINGIKTFAGADPVVASVYAASVVINAHTPLEGVFTQLVSSGDLKLYDTEEIVYEDRLGLSTWIRNERVLFGSAELMENHNIKIPENAKLDTGDKNQSVLYLAINDSLRAMFLVSYYISRSTSKFLKYLSSCGVCIMVSTNDPNITEEFIMKKCRLPENTVRIIGAGGSREINKRASVVHNFVPVGAVYSGQIRSLASVYDSCFTLEECRRMSDAFTIAGNVLGFAISVAFCVFGSFASLTNVRLVVFLLILDIICVLLPLLRTVFRKKIK